MKFNIPKTFTVGQQVVEIVDRDPVDMPEYTLGRCDLAHGRIFLNKDQSETSKENTCIHEMVHCILDTMGEHDLSHDEKFVSSFAAFALEIINTVK